MSKESKEEFNLDEPYEASSLEFFRGKEQGLFEAYDIVEQSITELTRSLDNVWTILDQADSYPLDARSQDQKDKMAFALHTLFVLRNIFEDKYYEKIEEAKRKVDGWEDAF